MQNVSTSSKCRNANILIIFYGGSHMFHSDPRMRSMPNYLNSGEYFSSCQDTGHWFWRAKIFRFGSTIDQTYFWSTIDYQLSTFEICFKKWTIDYRLLNLTVDSYPWPRSPWAGPGRRIWGFVQLWAGPVRPLRSCITK